MIASFEFVDMGTVVVWVVVGTDDGASDGMYEGESDGTRDGKSDGMSEGKLVVVVVITGATEVGGSDVRGISPEDDGGSVVVVFGVATPSSIPKKY
jgi:hypothetical protein